MSRGFGVVQQYLLGVIGVKPMSFEEILARAYPEGTFNGDLAKAIGGSNVGGVRSLRRALGKLVDRDIIQIVGRRPHRYRLHRLFASDEYNAKLIELLYKCIASEEGETLDEKDAAGRARFAKIANAVDEPRR